MFQDRIQAGRLLGERLRRFEDLKPLVLGLPRGGVPVATEVARALDAPLDVIVVRKLGVPGHPEYAMGAIGEGDVRFVDWQVVTSAGVTAAQLTEVIRWEREELARRAKKFRAGYPRLDLFGHTVIIVDDGIATGSTVTAAIRVARDLGAGRVIVATPVAPEDAVQRLREIADEVVVLETPRPFYAVGQVYGDFSQTGDGEVTSILQRARAWRRSHLLRPTTSSANVTMTTRFTPMAMRSAISILGSPTVPRAPALASPWDDRPRLAGCRHPI